MRIRLTVTEGPNRGRVFAFEEHSTFVVGRSPEAHFRLPEADPYFSRLHFLVEANPPLCRLVDLGSRNGTAVNGQRVQTADLRDGDLIQAGRTALRVDLEGAAPGAVPPTLSLAGPGQAPTLSPAPAPPAPDVAPDAPDVPGYELLRELGRGGMGVVYQARRRHDGQVVALKTVLPAVRPTNATLGRFLREANILRELDHPHIVRFLDLGHTGGRLFFVMDYVEGPDAAALLKAGGPLEVGRAVGLVCQLLEALAYAHGRGFVHRDIKPANLLVAAGPGREAVKLTDFGLARVYQASPLSGLTLTGSAAGTPAFMPPEQVLDFRSVQPAADQYSAAAALYNLLTGRHLFDEAGGSLELMMRVVMEAPVPLGDRRPDLPAGLAAVVHRALARKPEQRYPDVTAFRAALLPFGGSE